MHHRHFDPANVPEAWREEVEAWMRRLRYLERSPATVRTWGNSIQYFALWLQRQGKLAGVEAVRGTDVEGWIISIQDSTSSNTQKIRFSGLKSFFDYLFGEDVIPMNPMARLKPPIVKNPPDPAVLGSDYVKALLKATEGNDFESTRNRALIRLLLECGGRISEVLSMRMDRIDLNERSAVVRRKGGGERTVRWDNGAAHLLDRYLLRRRRHPKATLPDIWIGRQGPLLPDSVNRRLKKIAMDAGLPPTLHAHLFRHTWAHLMKDNDMSDESLRELGGWSPTSTVPLQYGREKRAERAKSELERRRPFDGFA